MMLGWLIDLGCKSALIAGATLLISTAMGGRPAAERAALPQAALVASLALFLLAPLLPPLDLAVLPASTTVSNAVATRNVPVAIAEIPRAPAAILDGAGLVAMLYAAGVGLLLVRFLAGLWILGRWTRAARPAVDPHWQRVMDREAASLRRPLRLLVSPYAVTPLSWGIAPAWILIGPATYDRPEQAEAVIAHELAHIRRFDWVALVVTRLTIALFWFNPLVWLVARQLMREIELAADADALDRVDRYDYAQALLAVAGGGLAGREANGMAFTQTALARRISTVLDAGAARRIRPLVPALLLVAALGSAVPLAAARIVRATAVPLALLAPIPEPPTPPVPPPSAAATPSAWPDAVRSAGHAGGRMLKRLGSGIKGGSTARFASLATSGTDGQVSEVRATIDGSPQNAEAAAVKRQKEEGAAAARRGREEQRSGLGESMRGTAVGFRARAEELERIADLPGQSSAVRASNLAIAKGFRASADDLDDKADKLSGT